MLPEMQIGIQVKNSSVQNLEIIERKCMGHPDSMADLLAEELSSEYSKYTLDRFGVVLHHNFDKLAILGGRTQVDFGGGKIIEPIRILLNGRASTQFGDEEIPVESILVENSKRFMKSIFGNLIDVDTELKFFYNVSNASGPGKIKSSKGSRANLFTPNSKEEVKGYDKLVSNDTSIGCGYFPMSELEQLIMKIDETLTNFRKEHNWLGTDIKIMASRNNNEVELTICIPQIAKYVNSLEEYKKNLKIIKKELNNSIASNFNINISLNTRDDFDKGDVYLTVTGSSIEAGDEGVVGRGNRVNGLITPFRPMNLEGASGKNPVYYVGKVYNVAAKSFAEKIHKKFNVDCEVYLVSQNGRSLTEPSAVFVNINNDSIDTNEIESFIKHELKKIPEITERIINKEIKLC